MVKVIWLGGRSSRVGCAEHDVVLRGDGDEGDGGHGDGELIGGVVVPVHSEAVAARRTSGVCVLVDGSDGGVGQQHGVAGRVVHEDDGRALGRCGRAQEQDSGNGRHQRRGCATQKGSHGGRQEGREGKDWRGRERVLDRGCWQEEDGGGSFGWRQKVEPAR